MKIKLRILLILSVAIAVTVIAIASCCYFSSVTYYAPVSIHIDGLSSSELKSVTCSSNGPLGNEISVKYDLSDQCFKGWYAFRKNICIDFPDSSFAKITKINFTHGTSQFTIPPDRILAHTRVYNRSDGMLCRRSDLSYMARPDKPFFSMLGSIFNWGGTFRIALWSLIAVILIAPVIIIITRKKTTFKTVIARGRHFAGEILSDSFITIKIRRITFWALLVILFPIFLLILSPDNGVIFQMSSMMHHSSGVNFAEGYGISRVGSMVPFENYRFNDYGVNLEFNYRLFTRFPGMYFYHSPPGYGFFLGVIYSIIGVNPWGAKVIQLLMLVIIACMLPVTGHAIWRSKGYWIGLPAALIFISTYYENASNIQPQSLLFFLCFILVVLYTKAEKSGAVIWIILLGFAAALAILTKISMLMFPVIMLIYLTCKFIKLRSWLYLRNIFLLFISTFLPLLAWSAYASAHDNHSIPALSDTGKMKTELFERPLSKADSAFLTPIVLKNPALNDMNSYICDGGYVMRLDSFNIVGFELFGRNFSRSGPVFIATQTNDEALFHAHNEYIRNGDFSADWYIHQSSFYRNDGLSGKPAWIRVLNFYLHHPSKIITLPLQKVYNGFARYSFLTVLIFAFILNSLLKISLRQPARIRACRAILFFTLNVVLLLPLLIIIPYLMYSVMLLLSLIFILMSQFRKNNISFFRIPAAFSILVMSLGMLTVLITGDRRFTEVADFIFILCGVFSVFYMNREWIFPDKPITAHP